MRLFGAETMNKQNKAQNVLEISSLGYFVIAYLGYDIPCGLEYPTWRLCPTCLRAMGKVVEYEGVKGLPYIYLPLLSYQDCR